jgi:hypothetical protein
MSRSNDMMNNNENPSASLPLKVTEQLLKHERRINRLLTWTAILSALLACLAAVVGYQTAGKANQAILKKNEVIIKTEQESNIWNLYQAKRTRSYLIEASMNLVDDPKKINEFKAKLAEYAQENAALKLQAKAIATDTVVADEASNQLLTPHKKLAQAMIFLQIAISIASITALTRKHWLFTVSIAFSLVGVVLACYGWLT